LKDEEAIDYRGGFQSFHWARVISSRKGHGGLPREKKVSWVGKKEKRR
jgi:ribosomal protein L37E